MRKRITMWYIHGICDRIDTAVARTVVLKAAKCLGGSRNLDEVVPTKLT